MWTLQFCQSVGGLRCAVPREEILRTPLPAGLVIGTPAFVGGSQKAPPEKSFPQLVATAGPDGLGIDVRLEALRSVLGEDLCRDSVTHLNQVNAKAPTAQAAIY